MQEFSKTLRVLIVMQDNNEELALIENNGLK